MKQVNRVLAVITLVGGAVVFVMSCTAKQPKVAPPTRGEQAFLGYCAMCHGDRGAGNGPLAAALSEAGATRPARLDDAERLESLGRDELIRVIMQGGLHTGRSGVMPPWAGRLDSTLIADIADYVLTLPAQRPVTPAATIQKFLEAPEGSAEDGRRLYVFYCSMCHGPHGAGDGLYADTLHARNNIRPRNLTDGAYIGMKTDEDLFVTISLGGGHGGKSDFMPAWSVTLSPAQIKSLISYIRVISGTSSKS